MKSQLFNDHWKFWKDKDSFALVWDIPEHAQDVQLPHDAMIFEKPYADSPNGGNTGFRDGHQYVYLKHFFLNQEDMDKCILLKFEGSYMNTFVYVNGQLAGKHHFGYTTFYVAIHDFLHEGDNEIRVQVRNGAMSNSRWYSGGGLYRDVYLLTSPALHIREIGSRVETLELTDELARLEVAVPIVNETGKCQSFELDISIQDKDGQLIQWDCRPYVIKAGESKDFKCVLTLEHPLPWTADTPYLYQVKVIIRQGQSLIDEDQQAFGIRTISVDSKRGLRINNQSVNLRGACIHHDSGLLGAATYEAAHRRQVGLLKDAGFNAIRMAHHPAAPALLRACDEIGLYVMDETFDMWTRFKSDFDYSLVFEEHWRKDVRAMVESDFNHPSVILYSIGNEIPEIATQHGSHLAKEIHDQIKSLDKTRPTLAGINGVFAAGDKIPQITADVVAQNQAEGQTVTGNVNDFMSIMDTSMDKIVVHPIISQNLDWATAATDVAGYNYMTARYQLDAKEHPNRVIVGSETYPPEIARNWELVQQLPSVIGDFTWTGWDYIGEAGVGVPAYEWGQGGFGAQFPCQLAFCGDIDITGFRRPASYYREIVFGLRKTPYITVQNPHHYGKKVIKTPWVISDSVASWTWSGVDGQQTIVEVYAPGDQVELYLNDCLIGRKAIGEEMAFVTYFEVPYQAGTLRAANYQAGQKIGESYLTSADRATKHLVAKVDFEAQDLVYLSLSFEDANGLLITDQDADIEVLAIEGAHLEGIGSGDPKPTHSYKGKVTSSYFGRAQIILKRTSSPISLTLKADDKEIVLEYS
ncbi:glycoside hydrolase family 2 TIM barrel-domain containing protein [Streptococcus plurextorum]|uniref:glycoside hydrolase family 2 TIM barrel-domain containing protein n=1 Tax=Streptococcus plurextorum TaxID=456876 RepID=UPI0004063DDD|nr:glycoside hydrolase family 2 TIM barrel-domain containing protein [Streptococcus plurextorum]